ncbi:MAG: phosphatidylinositol-3-phosphatase [Verrucomicrobiota bacterium]|jgi:acid phosphatase
MKSVEYLSILAATVLFVRPACAQLPAYDHVVVVIEENHSFGQIIGSSSAPNINALAAQGANITNASNDPQGNISGSHAVRHPSQPNYLEFYSGSNQGVLTDSHPGTSSEPLSSPPPFNTPNLGAALRNAGFTFATYSEDLPSVGFDGDSAGGSPGYQRKHNPVANWMNDANPTANQLPSTVNQPFTTFQQIAASPGGFANLPTVSFVVPNQIDDMHDGTIQQGDAWLKTNIIDTYLPWARTHNSLLIVTWDEDGTDTATNQIATIFAGANIKPGNYTETNLNLNNPHVGSPIEPGIQTPTGTAMNHYNVLATIEDIYALAHIGGAANRPGLSDIFVSAVSRKVHGGAGNFDVSLPLIGPAGIECRTGGAAGDYQIVVNFGVRVTFASVQVTGNATISSTNTNGKTVVINLTGVANAQTIRVTLGGVNDGNTTSDLTIPMSILAGDTTADGVVNSTDIAQTKSQSGAAVSSTNFREDVTADGNINSADIGLTKSKSGTGLP